MFCILMPPYCEALLENSNFQILFFLIFIYLLFLAVLGLSCGTQDLQLWHAGSVVVALGLSCPVACGILVPRPGIEPTSPALEGGFLTTGPPGKSPNS